MFVMQMFYYRTQFTLDRFGVSVQLNTIVVGTTELIANLVFTIFINKLPRKVYLRICLLILALLFGALVVVKNKEAQTAIEGAMRMFDTCIMIILGVYLPELFADDERGKGTNYVMSFGVLGSALSPVIL
jgi:MFS family permease